MAIVFAMEANKRKIEDSSEQHQTLIDTTLSDVDNIEYKPFELFRHQMRMLKISSHGVYSNRPHTLSLLFVNLYPSINDCWSLLIDSIFCYLSSISSTVCLPLFLCRLSNVLEVFQCFLLSLMISVLGSDVVMSCQRSWLCCRPIIILASLLPKRCP